jgi:hypothetical protein
VPVGEISIRRQLIKDRRLTVQQQWWIYYLKSIENLNTYFLFKNEISKYIVSVYNQVGLSMDNISHNDCITLYEDGDFAEVHNDDQSLERHAAIFVYFSEDHCDRGGEFLFGPDNKIVPTVGNFVMLDFTKNNISHSVNLVKDGFRRIAYIDFVANKDLQ